MLTHQPVPTPLDDEIARYRERIRMALMPKAVREEAFRQVARLRDVPVDGVEHYVIRGYLEAVIELPWPERVGVEQRLLEDLARLEVSGTKEASQDDDGAFVFQHGPCGPERPGARSVGAP
jgi:hypothetical protein